MTKAAPGCSEANRQLAKLLSGFVTGQIAVAKPVVAVAAHSFVRILSGGCTRAQCLSFQSCSCLSLDLSFVSCYIADWRTTGLFWANESTSKKHLVSVFQCREHPLAYVESLAKLAIASPLLIFLPTSSLLPIILFPCSHQCNFQQIWDRWTASEGAPHF